MEGRLWKTPGEEFELPARVGRFVGFNPGDQRDQSMACITRERDAAFGAGASLCPKKLRTACHGESSRSLSLKER
jgi:hypothetical protein